MRSKHSCVGWVVSLCFDLPWWGSLMGPSRDHWWDCTMILHVSCVLSPVPYSDRWEIVPPVRASFTCPAQKSQGLYFKNLFFANALHIVFNTANWKWCHHSFRIMHHENSASLINLVLALRHHDVSLATCDVLSNFIVFILHLLLKVGRKLFFFYRRS